MRSRAAVTAAALALGAGSRGDAGADFGATTRVGKDADTIYINSGSEPEFLDPGKCTDTVGAALIVQLFEGLTSDDPRDGHPVQGVATSWDKSDDNRLFRFHLRPDARWSDDKPVTAHDFEYAWKRVLRPATGSRAASNLYALKNAEGYNQGKLTDESLVGVRAADDLTLDVELEQPTPYFLALTSFPTLFPVRKDVVEAFEQRGLPDLWVRPENLVSNGPYRLSEWKFRYEITMLGSPAYWNRDRLKIRRIVWLVIDQYHAAMDLYKAGEVDYLGDDISPPSEYLSILDKKRDFFFNPYLGVQYYELNTRRPPLDDARVRRALDLALDKVSITERVLRGGQLPATHFVPDFTGLGYAQRAALERALGTSPFAAPKEEWSPQRARALMKEAGYEVVADGDGYRASGFPPVEILYNVNEGHKQVAVAAQEMWKRHLGVSVLLRGEDWKVMLKEYRDGNFQVIRLGWTADYDHPLTFLDLFRASSTQNFTGWSDSRYDALLKEAAGAPDPARGMALYEEAEVIAVNAMPRIPLYFDTHLTLVKPWVKGFWGSALHPHRVEYFWIDPAWQQERPNEPAFLPRELPPPGRLAP